MVLFEEEQLEEEACTEEPVQDRVFEAIKGLNPCTYFAVKICAWVQQP